MEPLEVFAIDDKLQRATASIPYRSLQWNRKYYECGDFYMEIPASMYDPSWKLIYADKRPETGIIQKIERISGETRQSEDIIALSGFFLESYFNNKTFLEESPEEETYFVEVVSGYAPKDDYKYSDLYIGDDGNYYYYANDGNMYANSMGSSSSDAGFVGSPEQGEDGNLYATQYGSDDPVKLNKVDYYHSLNTYWYHDDSNNLVSESPIMNDGNPMVSNVNFETVDGEVYALSSSNNMIYHGDGVVNSRDGIFSYRTEERTRIVKGPWQLTETYEPITETDNVAKCVEWAQRFFQNGILYEEPQIQGIKKVLDPSFQTLGSLLYAELQTVGASFRLVYDFVVNQFVFSVWQGLDRTQDQEIVDSEPIEPIWITTGKVQSAEIEAMPDTQVGKTIIYGPYREKSPIDLGTTSLVSITSGANLRDGVVFTKKELQWVNGSLDFTVDMSGIDGFKDWPSGAMSPIKFEIWIDGRQAYRDYENVLFSDIASDGIINISVPEEYVSGGQIEFRWNCVYNNGQTYGDTSGITAYATVIDRYKAGLKEVGLSVNGEKWSIDLDGNTLGQGKVLTIERDGTASIDGSMLPEEYTELEYIESTGTQYISPGIIPTENSKVIVDFQIVSVRAGFDTIFGIQQSTDQFAIRWTSSLNCFRAVFGKTVNFPTSITALERHTAILSADLVSIDGTSYEQSPAAPTKPYTIMANNTESGTPNNYTNCRLYSFVHYEGNEIILNLIPCRNASGQVGMYDVVRNKFYQNSGTGSFTAGPEKQTTTHLPTQTMPTIMEKDVSINTDSEILHYFDLEYQKYQEQPESTGNPFYTFSDTWGSIAQYAATIDESNYRNKCYVLYEYDQPTKWNSDGTPVLESVYETDESGTSTFSGWKVPYETKRGYEVVRIEDGKADKETYLDNRNSKPAGDDSWSREIYPAEDGKPTLKNIKSNYDNFISSIRNDGNRLLLDSYGVITTLDANQIKTDDYMSAFDLGDLVDSNISSIGIIQKARIIEAREVHEGGRSTVDIEIGEKQTKRG